MVFASLFFTSYFIIHGCFCFVKGLFMFRFRFCGKKYSARAYLPGVGINGPVGKLLDNCKVLKHPWEGTVEKPYRFSAKGMPFLLAMHGERTAPCGAMPNEIYGACAMAAP
jgi:hypothetical protein